LVLPYCGYAQDYIYGDVNGDDEVNIFDVTDLIDIILGGLPSNSAADVNSDGRVNIGDVTDVIDIILNK
jgi:hypothetical protein